MVQCLSPGNHKQQAQDLTRILEEQGYSVQQGAYEFVTAERCQELATCFGNNPASPYGITFLPAAPHEDISTYPGWGKLLGTQVNGVNMSANYRLDANETIVMLGQTPPRCLYYSYLPYVLDRWYPNGWSSSGSEQIGKCPDVTNPLGGRCTIFASLGNPINMLDMNTSFEGGQSFNSAFAHFMGGDMTQVEKIQNMSIDVGVQSSIHNIFGLSTARANLGLTPTSDAFLHLFRFAFIENPSELHEYVYNPSAYMTILRVTPPSGDQGPAFPPYVFKERISEPEGVASQGISHRKLKRALKWRLKVRVLWKHLRTHRFVKKMPLHAPSFEDGYDCMDQGIKCNGDNQDTLYPNSRKSVLKSEICTRILGRFCPITRRTTLQEDGSDFFIVTGVNHNATGRALYSNIAMYNKDRLESVGSFNSHELDAASYVGSANKYLGNRSISKYLFAVKVTRKCEEDETFCLELPTSGNNSLPLDTSCVFIERIYLDHMEAGPTLDATIKPIVYHFSSKLFEGPFWG